METKFAIIISAVSLIATLCGIATFVFSRLSSIKRDSRSNGQQSSDIQYIKRRIDDVLLEQRETNKTLDVHAERLARVEESVKQAHKRIDVQHFGHDVGKINQASENNNI